LFLALHVFTAIYVYWHALDRAGQMDGHMDRSLDKRCLSLETEHPESGGLRRGDRGELGLKNEDNPEG
jgi:hypothetical protein